MLHDNEKNSLRVIFNAVTPENLPDVLTVLAEVFKDRYGIEKTEIVATFNSFITQIKSLTSAGAK